ncbi:hypothetical protein LRS74_24325 [Streptomyces sp. LX-29]|uniref:hypothetical protein n=1 Tax=Streptomyces sp. LX-29 TaxID=2900152 RepID=UPI00240DD3E2|nr:hypothetical protein [Streptomyces sp. LX-29]WFB09825.1 hypothetical protein LRS74_24325 [Streptomyces sp. LX-29]
MTEARSDAVQPYRQSPPHAFPQSFPQSPDATAQSASIAPVGGGRHRGVQAASEDAQAPGHGRHRRPTPPQQQAS